MSEIKRMDIKEFREEGFLQEANRQFFHPLGLALEIIIDDETGVCRLGGVWDYRDDPEGMIFDESLITKKAFIDKFNKVDTLRKRKANERLKTLGYEVQPVKGEFK